MRSPVRSWLVSTSLCLVTACSGETRSNDNRDVARAVRTLVPVVVGSDDAGTMTTDSGTPNDAATSDDAGARDAGSDDGGTTADAGTPDSGTAPTNALPPFDSATDAHVRAIVAQGVAMGNRRNVFAKIGDSITESQSFLFDCGYGWINLGNYSDLADTIQYFAATALGDRNSFNRASVCAVGGWTTNDALQGYPDAPLTRELEAIQPMWAIVMYGTNDLQVSDVATYTTNLGRIVDIIEAHGTVPVLSTIPPRTDGDPYDTLAPMFNNVVRSLAAQRHIPLIDYYVSMMPLPSEGISPDGIHPNTYIGPNDGDPDACNFTSAGLNYGYNMRSFTAVQMLARLRTY